MRRQAVAIQVLPVLPDVRHGRRGRPLPAHAHLPAPRGSVAGQHHLPEEVSNAAANWLIVSRCTRLYELACFASVITISALVVQLPAACFWVTASLQGHEQAVEGGLRRCRTPSLQEVEGIEASMASPDYVPNSAQRRLAGEVTRFVHDEDGLRQALAATEVTLISVMLPAVTNGIETILGHMRSTACCAKIAGYIRGWTGCPARSWTVRA